MERKVKGTIFKMVVKTIRANKSGAYDTLLSDKAKEVINKSLDSIWYPFESFKECFNAMAIVEVEENEEKLIKMGQRQREALMSSFFKLSIVKGDLKSAMDKFKRFHGMIYNFSEMLPEFRSEREMIVTYNGFDLDFKNFYYLQLGWIEKFIKLCLDKKVQYEFLKKSWEGADATQILLSWNS